jgi:hypothetical protein
VIHCYRSIPVLQLLLADLQQSFPLSRHWSYFTLSRQVELCWVCLERQSRLSQYGGMAETIIVKGNRITGSKYALSYMTWNGIDRGTSRQEAVDCGFVRKALEASRLLKTSVSKTARPLTHQSK